MRTVWILSHRRRGDLDQMLALAQALGWPATVKRIFFRLPRLAAIPLLARHLFDAARSDRLEPPWPDVVVCAEGRASAIARVIKSRSGGTVKTVCLGRPAGSPAHFDLVLTTPQYRLAAGANVVELALPLPPPAGQVSGPDALDLQHLPRPLTAVLVGGTSLPERLDRRAAAGLARDAVKGAGGGSVVFVTSPRTDPAATAALTDSVAAPHLVLPWQPGADNPYWTVLAAADHVVVTSDSVSMVMDAFATGKPVCVYRLPRHHTMKNRMVNWLHGRKPAAWLFDHGVIEIRPDRRLLFERLVAQGRLHWFGERPQPRAFAALRADDTALAAAQVRRLFADAESCQ